MIIASELKKPYVSNNTKLWVLLSPKEILWKSLRLEISKRKGSHGVFITASLALNISAWFSKLLNIPELELQMLYTHEKLRSWQNLKMFLIHKIILASNRCDTPSKRESTQCISRGIKFHLWCFSYKASV